MKLMKSLIALALSLLLFGGIYLYLKNQDSNYDSLISQAIKIRNDHKEFIDFYGENEPDVPEATANGKDLSGIDANKNGIRDDVDIWINRMAYNLNETKGMRQFARVNQEFLKTCETRSEASRELLEKLKKAENCLSSMSDYQRKSKHYSIDKLNIILFNTDSRNQCFKSFSVALNSIQIPAGKNFDCDFEVQYPDNVVFGNEQWKKEKPN
jgi:hypothetical protein